jgi:AraC-like DNA-binding protein
MNQEIYSSIYGQIKLSRGWTRQRRSELLPLATGYYALRDFGSIYLQELRTEAWLLRYYIFHFYERMVLLCRERSEGLQSLLSIKGTFHHGIGDGIPQRLLDGQFILLDAGSEQTQTIIPADRECRVFNVYYPPDHQGALLQLFPGLEKDLKRSFRKPRFFLPAPRPARTAVLDAVREILFESYRPELQKFYWELKLRQSLFTQLAQTYTEPVERASTLLDKEIAVKAHGIILSDITQHYNIEELAQMIPTSRSSLIRAFLSEFGMGIHEYLMRERMLRARDLLLAGGQVKNVAPAVGLRTSHFTYQFQRWFGYKASSLHRKK